MYNVLMSEFYILLAVGDLLGDPQVPLHPQVFNNYHI